MVMGAVEEIMGFWHTEKIRHVFFCWRVICMFKVNSVTGEKPRISSVCSCCCWDSGFIDTEVWIYSRPYVEQVVWSGGENVCYKLFLLPLLCTFAQTSVQEHWFLHQTECWTLVPCTRIPGQHVRCGGRWAGAGQVWGRARHGRWQKAQAQQPPWPEDGGKSPAAIALRLKEVFGKSCTMWAWWTQDVL